MDNNFYYITKEGEFLTSGVEVKGMESIEKEIFLKLREEMIEKNRQSRIMKEEEAKNKMQKTKPQIETEIK